MTNVKRIGHAAGAVKAQKRVFTNAEIYAVNNLLAKSSKDIGGTNVAMQQIGEMVKALAYKYAKKVTPIREKV